MAFPALALQNGLHHFGVNKALFGRNISHISNSLNFVSVYAQRLAVDKLYKVSLNIFGRVNELPAHVRANGHRGSRKEEEERIKGRPLLPVHGPDFGNEG